MTVHQFIKRLGGVTAVARELGIPLTTVSGWGLKNSVPSWRMPKLAELALRDGVPIPSRFEDRAA